MIRSVLAAFLFLFVAVNSASALNCLAYPNPLANNTNADATQVMANFNLIRDCANNKLAATSGATFTGPTFFTGANVGVGTVSPGALLDVEYANNSGTINMVRVVGAVNTSNLGAALNIQAINHSGFGSDYNFQVGTWNGTVYTNLNELNLNANGNVGIGTTSPAFTLHVNGSVAGTSAYNNVSDGRLKKDITSLEYGLDTIMKLRPVGFNWIAQDQEWKKQHQIGLIAQEVEPVVPEAVTTANDALQTKSLAYSELVPVLIKAVQDLKSANDNLRAANDDGAAQIATLTARLDAIEAAHLTKAAASSSSRL